MVTEQEIYNLITRLNIDYSRLELLKDLSTEANLLLRSKLVKVVKLGYDDVLNITSLSPDKNILVTVRLEDYKFTVYIEKGVLVSSSMVSLTQSSTRVAGLKPLVVLAMSAKDRPVTAYVYEVLPLVEEEKTSQVPEKPRAEAQKAEAPAVQQPLLAVEAEKIKSFNAELERLVNDYSNFYGCRVVSFGVSLSKGVLYVRVSVKKAGLMKKCEHLKLKEAIERDLELLASKYDVNMPVKILVSLEQ